MSVTVPALYYRSSCDDFHIKTTNFRIINPAHTVKDRILTCVLYHWDLLPFA